MAGYPPSLPFSDGFTTYRHSKRAVAQLTKETGVRFTVEGVRISAVAAVFVHPPLTENNVGNPDVHARMKRLHPMGRMVQQEEVTFLALDDAAFATASVWPVDGRYTVRQDGTLSNCAMETVPSKHPRVKRLFEMTFLVAEDLQLCGKQDCHESAGNG